MNAVTAAPSDDASPPPLGCRNLRKHFGLRQVLRDVDLIGAGAAWFPE